MKLFDRERDTRDHAKTLLIEKISIAAIIFCLALFAGNYLASKGLFIVKTSPEIKGDLKKFKDIDKYRALFEVRDTLIKKFDGEIDDVKLLDGAIKGMTAALNDPYTIFMNGEEFEKFMKQSNGSITGIGITVTSKDNKITIIEPMKDSPAEKAGLQANDIIQKVNDVELSGEELSKAIEMIGTSESQVRLTIKRGEEEPFDVDVKIEKIKIESLKSEMIDSEIGYINIETFMNENTTSDFKEAIISLKEQGMKGLILDLRDNPGGLLMEAVGVASQFIPKDSVITYTIDKYDNKNESLSVGGIAEGIPLVVLVNDGSASASEVVTGALRDYQVATIVGDTTFGKGVVQQTLKFSDNLGGLKVTISKYYTPNGENINKKGITPDFEVSTDKRISEEGYDRSADAQFKFALDKVKEKVK